MNHMSIISNLNIRLSLTFSWRPCWKQSSCVEVWGMASLSLTTSFRVKIKRQTMLLCWYDIIYIHKCMCCSICIYIFLWCLFQCVFGLFRPFQGRKIALTLLVAWTWKTCKSQNEPLLAHFCFSVLWPVHAFCAVIFVLLNHVGHTCKD